MKPNRKHIKLFIEDFRHTRPQTRNIETGAALVRELTVTAVRSARQPLSITEVHRTIESQHICNFPIRLEFFLSSICQKMNETGIVIAGGKIYVL